MLLAGGGARGSDPCRDRGSEETGSQADVRRAGTPLPELEPQTETGGSTSGTGFMSTIYDIEMCILLMFGVPFP